MKEEFIAFLKENNAYDAFVEATTTLSTGIPLETSLCEEDPINSISSAFTWENSVQGLHYWDNLNDKWQKEIE